MATKKLKKNAGNDATSVTEDIAEKFIEIEKEFSARLSLLDKSSFRTKTGGDKAVEYIYNPLEYALNLHNQYIEKYCRTPKKIVFLGMNPGPFGMVQTGVPFGEIAAVKEYLKIDGKVGSPKSFHPSRKVEGLECKRSEVSGKRLWGLFQELTNGDPEIFFEHCFVHNYCPLALMSKSGLNITPADLKPDDQKTLNSICDEFLEKILRLLQTEIVVAVGRFAEKRVQETAKAFDLEGIKILCIPHPSPRSPGSKNWQEDTKQLLKKLEILDYIQRS